MKTAAKSQIPMPAAPSTPGNQTLFLLLAGHDLAILCVEVSESLSFHPHLGAQKRVKGESLLLSRAECARPRPASFLE